MPGNDSPIMPTTTIDDHQRITRVMLHVDRFAHAKVRGKA